MDEVYTVSTWRVQSGQEGAFLSAFRAMTHAATDLGGAREGMILRDSEEPNHFIVVRRWDDLAALERWGNERDPAFGDAIFATLGGGEPESFIATKVADIGGLRRP